MWDEEYSVDEFVYGESPNNFLLAKTASLKKGNALCLAEGEGRNAVHLAKHGFSATGGPRRTCDGYYESVVFDPDSNRVEITTESARSDNCF